MGDLAQLKEVHKVVLPRFEVIEGERVVTLRSQERERNNFS